jgi:lysozyme
MNMSNAARRALIEAFEGLREIAYRDCAGVLTVGYGHTTAIGAPVVVPGLRVSQAQADEILGRDLARVERGVTALLHVDPAPREFDALVDFAYNVGLGALRSSSLLRAFNRGDRETTANGFLNWAGCGARRGRIRASRRPSRFPRGARRQSFRQSLRRSLRIADWPPLTPRPRARPGPPGISKENDMSAWPASSPPSSPV